MQIFSLSQKHSLCEWLKYIETIHVKSNVLNLKSLIQLASKIKLLHTSSFVFLVGGTNGKGTTCYVLEKLLLASGFTVGLYTSPHLLKYSERVRINGNILDDYRHIRAFSYIHAKRENIELTYFEFITLSALFLFKEEILDVIILEVGLGGRLDATNIINADMSIITNISLEHTNILGRDRELIGYEKACIAKQNKILLIGDKDIPNSVYDVIKIKKTILKKFNYDWFIKKNKHTWNYISFNMLLYDLPYSQLSLSNVAIALTALFYSPFKINENIIRNIIPDIQLIGRFQIISHSPTVILDVAHNPNATLHLYKKLKVLSKKGNVHAVLGVLRDKDVKNMILHLIKLIDYWYFAPVNSIRSITVSELCTMLPKRFKFFDNISQAWTDVKIQSKKEDIILVFGSFLAVSEVMNIITL
ncbi:MAG TPA: bifunctional tetrahydrofolate synthase/dihydrofolate synthase [Buchnera sp. (in: enterobacteria)]|nr:bifunctional tetrahydrofolate synthase/dihydrofolate synthase [Buchnera sp. (in: enterobacteria)]